MSTHPTALNDQIDAATADALRQLQQVGTIPGARISHTDTPAWLADQFAQIGLMLTSGQGRLCPHIAATPNSPRVVHAFAWAPGLLVCPACRWLAAPSDTEDSTCDRCRRHPRTLYPTIAAAGPILFGYGLCISCHTTIG